MDCIDLNDIRVEPPGELGPYIISAKLELGGGTGASLGSFGGLSGPEALINELTQEAKKQTDGGTSPADVLTALRRAAENGAERILLKFGEVSSAVVSVRQSAEAGQAGISVRREWHTAYLGIGSNLGDRKENIGRALEIINASERTRVFEVSSVYETEPVGYLDQDKFLNAACRIETLLDPRSLVRFLLQVEDNLKRQRTIPNGPRTIDLDVLFYDDRITSFEEAIIPHPRLHERMFVLKPLCDIAPYLMHPVLGERVYRLAEQLWPEEPEQPERRNADG